MFPTTYRGRHPTYGRRDCGRTPAARLAPSSERWRRARCAASVRWFPDSSDLPQLDTVGARRQRRTPRTGRPPVVLPLVVPDVADVRHYFFGKEARVVLRQL